MKNTEAEIEEEFDNVKDCKCRCHITLVAECKCGCKYKFYDSSLGINDNQRDEILRDHANKINHLLDIADRIYDALHDFEKELSKLKESKHDGQQKS